jgi:hypothetical protein
MKSDKPLALPLLIARRNSEENYISKGEDCDHMAATAYSATEKEAWLELARDWKALARELNEPLAGMADHASILVETAP